MSESIENFLPVVVPYQVGSSTNFGIENVSNWVKFRVLVFLSHDAYLTYRSKAYGSPSYRYGTACGTSSGLPGGTGE